MAANTSPIFTLTPNVGRARVAAANTARDGSGTLVTLFTAGANGSKVFSVTITSAQATAAANSLMVARLFVTDTSGANPRMLQEIVIPAVVASNTAVGATVSITFNNGLALANGQLLQCCQSVYAGAQDQMDFITPGGDY